MLTSRATATDAQTRVEALAYAQLGVLTRAQCLGLGMTPDAIRWLLRSDRWQRVHLGVYARQTGSLNWTARVSAALLDTVLDMAERGDADKAIARLSKACQRHRTTTAQVAEALDRRARHRWRGLLVDALSDVAGGVESALEYRYVRRVERPHGLPRARRQRVAVIGGRGRRTDNDYEPFGVVVELDGRLGHEGEAVFRDRTRDNDTTISGKATLRFGWADIDAHACEVAQDVGLVLWSRGWRGKLRRCGVDCRVRAGS